MTTTPDDPTTARPRRPPVVDVATWQAVRDELLVREKAYTREGDALAAARRRLPMVEFDGTVEVVGPDGPVPFLGLFQGRDELVVYKHMWYDGAPHQGQCEGCTFNVWHASVGGEMGHIVCFLRDGDRVFLTYSTTGRGNEPVDTTLGLLDMSPTAAERSGRTTPKAGPRPRKSARRSVGMARQSVGTGARTPTGTPPGARPAAPYRSGPAPARSPRRPSAGTATAIDGLSSTASAKVRVGERNRDALSSTFRIYVQAMAIDPFDARWVSVGCRAVGEALDRLVHRVGRIGAARFVAGHAADAPVDGLPLEFGVGGLDLDDDVATNVSGARTVSTCWA